MRCPLCDAEVLERFTVFEDDYVSATFECDCGCVFSADYPVEAKITIEEWPLDTAKPFIDETARDNPRDPIIERS